MSTFLGLPRYAPSGVGALRGDQSFPDAARTALGNCSPDSTELSGYSLIQADDLEAATAIAKGCPHLERSGGVEVGLLGEITGA